MPFFGECMLDQSFSRGLGHLFGPSPFSWSSFQDGYVAIYSQAFPATRAQGTIHDQPAEIDLDEDVSEEVSDEP